jgi:hypothetical protein
MARVEGFRAWIAGRSEIEARAPYEGEIARLKAELAETDRVLRDFETRVTAGAPKA